jgi:hypothetical protein
MSMKMVMRRKLGLWSAVLLIISSIRFKSLSTLHNHNVNRSIKLSLRPAQKRINFCTSKSILTYVQFFKILNFQEYESNQVMSCFCTGITLKGLWLMNCSESLNLLQSRHLVKALLNRTTRYILPHLISNADLIICVNY